MYHAVITINIVTYSVQSEAYYPILMKNWELIPTILRELKLHQISFKVIQNKRATIIYLAAVLDHQLKQLKIIIPER